MKEIIPLSAGQPAPDFALPDLDLHLTGPGSYPEKIVIINFWSAECPVAKRIDTQLIPWVNTLADKVVLLTIAANSVETSDLLRQISIERHISFVLRDEHQHVTNLFGAQTTPHFFVLDCQGFIRYQGPFDDLTFHKSEPTTFFVKEAVENLLEGKLPTTSEAPPFGCAIIRFSHP